MHQKVDHLFVQKLKYKKTLDKGKQRNKLRLSLLSLLLDKLPSDSLQCKLFVSGYLQATFSRTLSVTFSVTYICTFTVLLISVTYNL